MTTIECDAQLRVLETAAQNRANNFFGVVHFETGIEGPFVDNTIAQNVCDSISYAIGACRRVIDPWQIHGGDTGQP